MSSLPAGRQEFSQLALMPLSNFSRRQRISEVKSEKKLIYAFILSITVFIALLFYGIPALINMSVFISNLSHKNAPTVSQNTDNNILLPPTLQPLPEATNSATIAISGLANKGEKITLLRADEELDTAETATDGSFLFPNVNLTPGHNSFTAVAKTSGNRQSNASQAISVYYKNTPPKLEITSPQENTTITGDNKFVTVSGTTDAQNMLFINNHIAVVNPDGSFSYQQGLNDGDNTIKITAQDSAGNQTSTEIHVKYSSS